MSATKRLRGRDAFNLDCARLTHPLTSVGRVESVPRTPAAGNRAYPGEPLMLRKFAVVLTGLMRLATTMPAQDVKDKAKPAKKAKEKAKAPAKGTRYEVVSV